jgi:hypothetical protein
VGGNPQEWVRRRYDEMNTGLIILLLILLALAIGGGIYIHQLFWLLLILVLVGFAVGVFTGRITE